MYLRVLRVSRALVVTAPAAANPFRRNHTKLLRATTVWYIIYFVAGIRIRKRELLKSRLTGALKSSQKGVVARRPWESEPVSAVIGKRYTTNFPP